MRCGVLVLALALVACGSSAADSSRVSAASSSTTSPTATPARCGPAGARTLAVSAAARVYVHAGVVYGCSDRTHRVTRLGQSRRCIASSRAGPAAVAGQLVAYGLQSCGVDAGSAEVVVRRLTDGVMLRTLDATMGQRGPESYQSVASIVVRPNGAAAWIGTTSSIVSHRSRLEVLAANAGHPELVLDAGSNIRAASLALQGSRLTWKDGGRTRSASLR